MATQPHPQPLIVSFDVGRKNLAVCCLRLGPTVEEDSIVGWKVMTAEPSAEGMVKALRGSAVDAWLGRCSRVVIERQPPRNATMSRLQHYLELYSSMFNVPVYVQDAKHKLSFAASTPYWPDREIGSWTYHQRKKLSVETVQNYLKREDVSRSHDGDALAAFHACKKKDDFADCLLQAMAFGHHVMPGLTSRLKAPK